MTKKCKKHGVTKFIKRAKKENGFRCGKCCSEAVSKRRRKVKDLLVKKFGGKCTKCGYDKYVGALVFHHRNPETKDFGLSVRGLTKSYAKLEKEAKKCVLLCHNCHAETHHDLY